MKRVFHHPPEGNGRKYWRSLGQQADTPEFRLWLEREFPQGAHELELDGISRRNFLQLMGASVALAGLGMAGCRRPEAYLVPYAKSVEWLVPGKHLQYATAMPRRGGAVPLVATCYEGRPTKLSGNSLVPGNGTATDVPAQGAILDLYDPDRARGFELNGEATKEADFDAFLQQVRSEALASGGRGVAILAEPAASPTRLRMRALVQRQFPELLWVEHDALEVPVALEAERQRWRDGREGVLSGDRAWSKADWTVQDVRVAAAQQVFDRPVRVVPDFEKARVILSLDADIFGAEKNALGAIAGFAAGRRSVDAAREGQSEMNRLYVIESRMTSTGAMADHRLRMQSGKMAGIAAALARELVRLGMGGEQLRPAVATLETGFAPNDFQTQWIAELAADLVAAGRRALVVAGAHQPLAVHALAYAINAALGAVGSTLTLVPVPETEATGVSVAELVRRMNAGAVQTLFIMGGNPAFELPIAWNWIEAQSKVPRVIRLASHVDETAMVRPADAETGTKWFVPRAHFLEAWGDARGYDGTYLCVQPMILPLFGGWSELELLARLAGLPKPTGPELVQETFRGVAKESTPATFDADWRRFVRDGFLAGSGASPINLNLEAGAVASVARGHFAPGAAPTSGTTSEESVELVLYVGAIAAGARANNGWLQEMPEPMTKLTWGNALLVSPALARKLSLQGADPKTDEPGHCDVVKITTQDGRTLEAPVLIVPGQAENSVALAVGYGRTHAGRVGSNVGVRAFALQTKPGEMIFSNVKLEKTGETAPLAITQEHGSMEGRGLVREAPLEHFKKDANFVQSISIDAHMPGHPNYVSAYESPPMNAPHQWGMVVDLNTCVGCNACMIACQAENNIPIVGKEQVSHGREMHWIRVDRYFAGDDVEDPQSLFQPVACMQCENAPCETVCPVNATIHNDEGLNVMAYNRCVGTRYCANNCPYKVRRFNFFNYNERPLDGLYLGPLTEKGMDPSLQLQKNPNVTVRIRGVMEKCTFCVQRIEEAKINQLAVARDSANTTVPRDSFKTACQEVCPAQAITFGNIADSESAVSKLKASPRNYALLGYLNTRPRLTYLARIRNPNLRMPDADKIGRTSAFGHEAHDEKGHGAAHEETHAEHEPVAAEPAHAPAQQAAAPSPEHIAEKRAVPAPTPAPEALPVQVKPVLAPSPGNSMVDQPLFPEAAGAGAPAAVAPAGAP